MALKGVQLSLLSVCLLHVKTFSSLIARILSPETRCLRPLLCNSIPCAGRNFQYILNELIIFSESISGHLWLCIPTAVVLQRYRDSVRAARGHRSSALAVGTAEMRFVHRRLFKAQFRSRGPQFDTISKNVTAQELESNRRGVNSSYAL